MTNISFDLHPRRRPSVSDIRRGSPPPSADRSEHFDERSGAWGVAHEPVSPVAPVPDWPTTPSPRVRVPSFFHRAFSLWRVSFLMGMVFLLLPLSFVVIQSAINAKTKATEYGLSGQRAILLAVESVRRQDFSDATVRFHQAAEAFAVAEQAVDHFGGKALVPLRWVPGISTAVSGQALLEAGHHFSVAGEQFSALVAEQLLSGGASAAGESFSPVVLLEDDLSGFVTVERELKEGMRALERVEPRDIPEAYRDQFLTFRNILPTLTDFLEGWEAHRALLKELLGGNGPRKYLFLLQNNQEMRATGGFIGTYAILEMNGGKVKRFFVDGIFNPDGQLKENVVPPQAIQKVSAGWSLHDSNWFPDFPMSAEKAIFFYEKTGGPTVDGVVALTPTVMQKLLSATGPIRLDAYGLEVDADNFIPAIQEQVEVKYDKEENRPKQVLADLSTALFERTLSLRDPVGWSQVVRAVSEGLNERHILLYARDENVQSLIDAALWSGRMLETPKDYLSVIHTNINGYKTDGVIDETIRHRSDIQSDGTIIDTVTITREHRGGQMPYEWWNKVNADYMRVYVPKGSELLSAKGATWEFPEAPLDYERLGFRRDADVEREERSIRIDDRSGTRIYEDADKTVFGAWVYVSPQESATVEYRYRLPFRIDVKNLREQETDAYSVLFQKQAGSIGSRLVSSAHWPAGMRDIWRIGENLVAYPRELRIEQTLRTDVFWGVVFGAEE